MRRWLTIPSNSPFPINAKRLGLKVQQEILSWPEEASLQTVHWGVQAREAQKPQTSLWNSGGSFRLSLPLRKPHCGIRSGHGSVNTSETEAQQTHATTDESAMRRSRSGCSFLTAARTSQAASCHCARALNSWTQNHPSRFLRAAVQGRGKRNLRP